MLRRLCEDASKGGVRAPCISGLRNAAGEGCPRERGARDHRRQRHENRFTNNCEVERSTLGPLGASLPVPPCSSPSLDARREPARAQRAGRSEGRRHVQSQGSRARARAPSPSHNKRGRASTRPSLPSAHRMLRQLQTQSQPHSLCSHNGRPESGAFLEPSHHTHPTAPTSRNRSASSSATVATQGNEERKSRGRAACAAQEQACAPCHPANQRHQRQRRGRGRCARALQGSAQARCRG